eukprot:snap_masked-scaffold_43-processed-gene-1.72-mRNA-1 protein AED:0.02 eAED:0.02 QI:0/-1/0/1/-1/1/1/0/152
MDEQNKIIPEDVEEIKKQSNDDFVLAKDQNSVHIANLDDEVTPEDLNNFFINCGVVNRITIMVNKYTGKSKGFAYVEFEDENSVDMALGLSETELKGRAVRISRKRTNIPKFMLRGRGRGSRGRGRGRGFRGRSRGRGFRARGRGRARGYYK